MKNHKEVLAKSLNNGGTTLYNHLKQVAAVAEKTADHFGFATELIRDGALLHDIGKAHPDFQRMLSGQRDDTKIDFRHEIASILFLPLFPQDNWPDLIDLVIAHHRSPKKDLKEQGIIDLSNMEGIEDVFERHFEKWDEWSPIALEILSELGININPISRIDAKDAFEYVISYCRKKPLGWSKLKGLLCGSDHFASAINDKSFEYAANLFTNPDLSFFDISERKSSLYPLSLIETDCDLKHSLVIAPTGAGKTDFLMRRCRSRVFYTLPFQASINAMYERFKTCLPTRTDIRVLHAASTLNVKSSNSYEERSLQPMIGSAIKVLTPHQLAALICGTKGFESIALDITGCDVILDEIHSYSDIAQSMVLEIIKVLLKLNCRIHVGSATMPSVLVNKIIEIIGGKEQVYLVELAKYELDKFNRHKIFKHKNERSAFDMIEDGINHNNKILIVCNRVETAQRRFVELKEIYPEIPMLLLHSRFRRKDRAALEKELQDNFNDRKKMPGACIVVSTQVVEVSLDISFDLMISDTAPLDSLIQRFGRINRKRTELSVRNKILKNIHIIAPPEKSGDCLPYKKEILDKSFEAFEDGECILEREVQEKIDHVYPEISVIPIGTQIVWDGDQILLTELCHYPKSVLIETLNIESASCIRQSDQEIYEKGNTDDRISLEIPLPISAVFRTFTNFGNSKYGRKPKIVHDELYDETLGFQFKEINNFL